MLRKIKALFTSKTKTPSSNSAMMHELADSLGLKVVDISLPKHVDVKSFMGMPTIVQQESDLDVQQHIITPNSLDTKKK